MLKKFMNTVFPKFGDLKKMKGQLPAMPHLEADESTSETDASDVDFVAQFNKKEAAFRRKEDEDVAMFMSLVDRMSVKSLVFLLQAHARSMHNVQEAELQQTLVMIHAEQESSSDEDSSNERRKNIPKVNKKCRFAEIMGGQRIRETIIEIPHCNEYSDEDKADMWWSEQELTGMKREAAKVVNFFQDYRPEYAQSVEVLAECAEGKQDAILLEYHMKKLSQNSFPRGLECHIVPCIGEFRDDGLESVLSVQERYRLRRLSAQTPALSLSPRRRGRKKIVKRQLEELKAQEAREPVLEEQIRESYRKASASSKTLALKLAECDHIEALKASISRWAPETSNKKGNRALPPRNPSLNRRPSANLQKSASNSFSAPPPPSPVVVNE